MRLNSPTELRSGSPLESRSKRILYLTYDGISDALGYSQVFSYLKGLSKKHSITLISFEKPGNFDLLPKLKEEAKEHGIRWFPLRYHKSPTLIATSFDIAHGLLLALYLSLKGRFDVVHARSYVVAVTALLLKKLTGSKFLFDMRGFWVDERVESGLWPKNSALVRFGRFFERRFFLNADRVVSLSHAGAEIIKKFDYLKNRCPQIDVITTCTDLGRFKLQNVNPIAGRFVLGYVGSVGLWYDFAATARCFKLLVAQRPELRPFLYIANQREHTFIRGELDKAGISPSDYSIEARSFNEMPLEFAKMSAGIFFIRPTFAKQASAPTKLGEYLASGIPCLINANIGDSGGIVGEEKVGVVLESLEDFAMCRGIDEIIALSKAPHIREHCRNIAEKLFSLEGGIKRYDEIYQELSTPKKTGEAIRKVIA